MNNFELPKPFDEEPTSEKDKNKKRKRSKKTKEVGSSVLGGVSDGAVEKNKATPTVSEAAMAYFAAKKREEAKKTALKSEDDSNESKLKKDTEPQAGQPKEADRVPTANEEAELDRIRQELEAAVEEEILASKASPESDPIDTEAEITNEKLRAESPDIEVNNTAELEPDELSGGEVIFKREDGEAFIDHVVVLHESNPSPAASPMQSPVSPLPIAHAQPGQQLTAAEANRPDTQTEPNRAREESSSGIIYTESAPPNPEQLADKVHTVSSAMAPAYGMPHHVYNPNVVPQQSLDSPDSGIYSPNRQLYTKQQLEDEVYYASKSAQNRGVLSGLIAGGAIEHFRHRSREKKAEKRFHQQSKQLEQARQDGFFQQQEAARGKSNIEARSSMGAASSSVTPETRFAGGRFEQARAEQGTPAAAESPTARQANQHPPEQLEIPADHRLETSAWHTMEIDAKTGRPVENPSFEYGREYHHERAQETKLSDQQHSAVHQTATAGLGSALAGSTTAGDQTGPVNQPRFKSDIPSATKQEASTARVKAKAKAGIDAVSKQASTAGPIWPLALALVVITVLIFIIV